jgi:hypothetical protein
MGQAMGADFSGVKVHTDAQSDQLNKSIQAKAFTTGQDVFFRQGAYEPSSQGGQELIAHELTHVVQQNGGGKVQRKPKKTSEISSAPEQIQPFLGGLFKKAEHTKILDVRLVANLDSKHGLNAGTKMTFEIDIDVPKKKKQGTEDYSDFGAAQQRSPFSIYGVTLNYWEDIDNQYTFTSADDADDMAVQNDKDTNNGGFHKPWNDIYSFRPGSPTFKQYGALSWFNAVQKAANGELAPGQHTVTVEDYPGLVVKPNKYGLRTLRFRVAFNDASGNSKEFYATQVLKMENGVIVQNNYEDTAGNRVGGGGQTNRAITAETLESIRSQLPGGQMQYIGAFYRKIMGGSATPFNFIEADQAAAFEYGAKIPQNLYQSSFMDTDFWYQILCSAGAGTYGLPGLRTGESYVQESAGGSNLLVAKVKGGTISKMYLTNGSTTDIEYKDKGAVQARQFTEIPPATLETFKDRV